jgi:hypothetical protein
LSAPTKEFDMVNRRSLMAGGLIAAASSLTGIARAEGKPMLVFVGHEL